MSVIDIPIEVINDYLSENPFEVKTFPGHDDNPVTTEVKVKLTGVKNYISIGDNKPHIEYTLFILPTNEKSDTWATMYSEIYGSNTHITTTSNEYAQYRFVVNNLLSDLLKYFGVEMPTICTRVVNKIGEKELNESLLMEDKYDSVVRAIVRDIITIFKKHGEGEYGLPEDLRPNEIEYMFPQIENSFSVFVDMSFDESVEGFDADADYYNDEDLIYVTIKSNPKFGSSIIYDMVGELNELIRHELEHISQHEKGYEFPKREPKKPLKYYTQQHELDAQKKGFKRKSKVSGLDYETVIRNWFEDNKHKHRLTKDQEEMVIQRLLQEK